MSNAVYSGCITYAESKVTSCIGTCDESDDLHISFRRAHMQ